MKTKTTPLTHEEALAAMKADKVVEKFSVDSWAVTSNSMIFLDDKYRLVEEVEEEQEPEIGTPVFVISGVNKNRRIKLEYREKIDNKFVCRSDAGNLSFWEEIAPVEEEKQEPKYEKIIASLQSKIDALMLEYCSDEMSPEQLENWGRHQKPVEPQPTRAGTSGGGVKMKTRDKFERENRYLVIKRSDLYLVKKLITPEAWSAFNTIEKIIKQSRRNNGNGPLCCVVVEHDWPEYEPTWAAIEERVNAEDGKKVIATAISFIDQMRAHGFEGTKLPAEYDDLVDAVKPYRTDK